MSFQSELMDAIKARFVEVAGGCEFGGTASVAQAPYYVARLEDNLMLPMSARHLSEYSRGSGSELGSKMKSLRSSSAMTFNLLGNGPVHFSSSTAIPDGIYTVEFEYQLPTLAGNPNPANLDALLITENRETEIYCEMKMTEWILGRASGLRGAYLDERNYLIPENEASVFVAAFRKLCSDKAQADGKIAPKLYRYDAFQMLKHLLAIFSCCHTRKVDAPALPRNVMLINCVWEINDPETLGEYSSKYQTLLNEEHDQFNTFKMETRRIRGLFENIGVAFNLDYVSFLDLSAGLILDPMHREALNRYIV